eukprot:CAMPEP_0194545014 /NCGR_PEP_ID=MMETSP0253-20130528/88483_1 /TAXON_ID=2966 /ORGANISM="Noctiluca scintillans" /LENGTH=40 /DNA_ID= /DNA_START= /DNA_END= /DNA_ORIENTATION=
MKAVHAMFKAEYTRTAFDRPGTSSLQEGSSDSRDPETPTQ